MADFVKILLRRDSQENWSTNNPILALGEPAIGIDQNGSIIGLKIGDGHSHWNDIEYLTGDFSALNQRVTDLETFQRETTSDLSGLHESVDGLDTELNGEGGITSQIADLNSFKPRVVDNERDIAQLQRDLTAEVTTRTENDRTLSSSIAGEIGNRQEADRQLGQDITNINNKFQEGTTSENPAANVSSVRALL